MFNYKFIISRMMKFTSLPIFRAFDDKHKIHKEKSICYLGI